MIRSVAVLEKTLKDPASYPGPVVDVQPPPPETTLSGRIAYSWARAGV